MNWITNSIAVVVFLINCFNSFAQKRSYDAIYSGIPWFDDRAGERIFSSNVDMYCKYSLSTLKFLTPVLAKGDYTLTVSLLGENCWWIEKSGRRSGSREYFVSLEKIVVKE